MNSLRGQGGETIKTNIGTKYRIRREQENGYGSCTQCGPSGLPVDERARQGAGATPVENIVKQVKEAFTPVRPSTRKVEIITTAEGETLRWVAREAMKQFPDGKRMVMVMLEPQEVNGNAYVVWEPKGKASVIWTYMPVLRRVRELMGVDAYEHFLGTDFTYADLGFIRLHP